MYVVCSAFHACEKGLLEGVHERDEAPLDVNFLIDTVYHVIFIAKEAYQEGIHHATFPCDAKMKRVIRIKLWT